MSAAGDRLNVLLARLLTPVVELPGAEVVTISHAGGDLWLIPTPNGAYAADFLELWAYTPELMHWLYSPRDNWEIDVWRLFALGLAMGRMTSLPYSK